MALFQSDIKETLKRLANREFASGEERDEMLAQVAGAAEVRLRDVMWMLFRPDRAIRDVAAKIVARQRDPDTLAIFMTEAKGKPDAAFRAAAGILFASGLTGIESEIARFIVPQPKETKETAELRESARRLLLEAPPSAALAPMLWQLAISGRAEDRLPILTRLAAGPMDEKAIVRWQRIAQEPDDSIREKALEVLATRAAMSVIPLLVRELPRVSYTVQQVLIEALTNAAAMQPPSFADELLPLIASGEAGTRTAVMKILLGMRDRNEVVKRYIRFTTTLAGFVRDRALQSIKIFGSELIEPTIELLSDADEDLRAAALPVACEFDDPRVVPATITLLKDP
ncbi:MAG TPA: hypothetical protein VF701_07415, partial [Thermoanaerobaculia bacterium]